MKEIDWSNLSFGYMKTDYNVRCYYRDGKWGELELCSEETLNIHMAATCLHYGQEAFEGLKAYRGKDGKIRVFRPDANAERLQSTCRGILMPEFSTEKFCEAVRMVVKANERFIPPYESGASLYIRPFMIGSGPQIGVAPAHEFLFRITVMPVGAYFQGAVKPLKVRVSDYDRAAPRGTGHVKAGLNYAMSLYPTMEAHRHGFAENIYLDPASRTYVEEAGGANVIFVDKDNNLIVPKSDSILPSITRRSLVYVGEHYLGLNVIERKVALEEVKDFKEAALCGTAAVLAPIGEIHTKDGVIALPSGMDKMGEISGKLRETLTGIQACEIEAPEGWVVEVCKESDFE